MLYFTPHSVECQFSDLILGRWHNGSKGHKELRSLVYGGVELIWPVLLTLLLYTHIQKYRTKRELLHTYIKTYCHNIMH